MSQTVTIPAGRYVLTAKARAAAPVTFTISAGGESVTVPCYNDQGNVFDRGWGDNYFEFVSDGFATILVTTSSNEQYSWFSISDFRLVLIGGTQLFGDVDLDGDADWDDVRALSDMLVGRRAQGESGDINNDTNVSLADLTMLVNYLLQVNP